MTLTPVKVDSRWTFDPTAEDTIRISVLGVPGTPGATGNTGPAGATGATGPGVATGGTAGQLLAKIDGTNYNTHWITASGTGTVTSVDLALPVSMFSVSGNPVTSSGTLTAAFAAFAAHKVLIGPTTGPATTPTVRVLQASDLPSDVAYTDVVNIFSTSQRVRTGQSGQPAFSIDAGHSQYNWISFTENDGLGTFIEQATLGYFPSTQQLFVYAPAGLRGGFVDDGSGTTVIPQSGITGLVSALAGKQPLDATLTSLAAFNTNGIVTQTAADTFTGRTLTGTTNKIDVSNGDGVSGNPTVTISSGYVGQTSITTLGTITTGTWTGTTIAVANGGTGSTTASTARNSLGLDVISASLFYSTPVDSTVVLTAKAAYAFTINQIRGLKTSSGTLTLAIKINGTNVTGLSSLSVTSTPQDVTATAANSVAIGDRITAVISSSSTPADLEFTLKATR